MKTETELKDQIKQLEETITVLKIAVEAKNDKIERQQKHIADLARELQNLRDLIVWFRTRPRHADDTTNMEISFGISKIIFSMETGHVRQVFEDAFRRLFDDLRINYGVTLKQPKI